MSPTLRAQNREAVMTVDSMARVIFVAGFDYEVAAKFPTIDAAYAALKSARAAVDRLDGICRGVAS